MSWGWWGLSAHLWLAVGWRDRFPVTGGVGRFNLLSAAVRNTAANQLWRILAGPFVLLLIPIYLSAEAQGYWYTFVSLGALTVFADLGFSAIIVHFVAHEFARLEFDRAGFVVGDVQARARLASLFVFASRWSFGMLALVVPISIALGLWLMSAGKVGVDWRSAWVIYSVGCGFNFFLTVLLAFLEGSNRVAEAQRQRLVVSIINALLMVGLLLAGAQLYALALPMLLSGLFGVVTLSLRFRATVFELLSSDSVAPASWTHELFPLLKRYAVSWTSGYFILQSIPPLVFYFYGPIDAGRVGLSMAIWMAIFSLSNVWIVVATPKVSMHISLGDSAQLLHLFRTHFRFSVGTFLVGSALFLSALLISQTYSLFAQRLLPIEALLILGVGWLAQLVVSALAMFMRAHKEEPLMWVSVAMAVQIVSSTILLAGQFDVRFIAVSFTAGFLIWLPLVVKLYRGYLSRYE